jgi:3-hydroxyisobutyrate dehydrogenase-like beta-hydroxyacid dehydrogenase
MRITFIGFGEVAGAFCGALASRGADIAAYDVLLGQPEGLERLRARAGSVAVSFLPLPDALYGAKYVLSTVTTTVARAAAKQCAEHLKPGQRFLDLNATEPEAKKEIAKVIEASGASFVEGALLGAVGVTGAKTEILLGGPHARDAEAELAGTLGLNAKFYSEELGRASMFKMLRSVFSKGMEALLIEFLVAAERAGLRADLWSEVVNLFATQPFEKVALNWVRSHSGAHGRRREEVKQVVGVLRSLGIEPTMTSAAQEVFEQSARANLGPLASADEVIRFLEQRKGR